MVATDDRTEPSPAPIAGSEALHARARQIAATCAGFNLRRASRAVSQHFDRALAPVGLRMTQFTLLSALAAAGSATINQLARALVLDRTTLTRNLGLLRQAGLVRVQAGATGREQRFSLTPSGTAALERAYPLWRVAQATLVDAFDAARWPALVADLDRLVDGVLGEHTHPVLSPREPPPAPMPTEPAGATTERPAGSPEVPITSAEAM